MVLVIAWAGFVAATDGAAQDSAASEFSSEAPGDDVYVADPSQSFIVEHSGQVAAAAPRPAPPRDGQCRAYSTDDDGAYTGGLACPQPDGSWRIVSGARDMIRPRENDARTAAPYPEYPDYADDGHDERETVRPSRRFRLDWDAWSSARRGNAYRAYGYRNE